MKNSNTSSTIRLLRADFIKLIHSSEYEITQEIFNHIQGIISALDSLKLDDTLNQTDKNNQYDQSCKTFLSLTFFNQ